VGGAAQVDAPLAGLSPTVLHFGVSSRARLGSGSRPHARTAAPDAAGVLPPGTAIAMAGAEFVAASLPVHIATRLRGLGIPAFVSRDAGGYLCNATLYHSLGCARDAPGRRVGFIHIPATLGRPGGANRGRVGGRTLTWEQAHAGGIEILAACLHRPATLARTTAA
jgi:pyroglutamyl-peptidase